MVVIIRVDIINHIADPSSQVPMEVSLFHVLMNDPGIVELTCTDW